MFEQSWQKYLVASGFSLVGLSLAADWLGLSTAGFSRGQFLLFAGGLGLSLTGYLGKRTVTAYQSLALLFLNTLVLLVFIEIGAGFLSKMLSVTPPIADPDRSIYQPHHPYYATQTWAKTYWREQASLQTSYSPYLVWLYDPFAGETIHINNNHQRLVPTTECETQNAFEVWTFGGSTIWGYGSPDWGTIPVYLQAQLRENVGQAVCMVNYGQSGHNSSQGIIRLMMELRNKPAPDLVIFYDGINDVYAVYQSGDANAHQNQRQIMQRLKPLESNFLEDLRQELVQNTYSFALIDSWFNQTPDHEQPDLITYASLGGILKPWPKALPKII